jgi:hypothetical protein
VREILAGEPIQGTWFNRTQEYAARNRGEDFGRMKYATAETFELSPLPCWAHLSPEAYRQRVAGLVEKIESEAAAELARSGRMPLGVDGVLRQSPEARPIRSKKSPAPLYHAATRAVRKSLLGSLLPVCGCLPRSFRTLESRGPMARFPLGSFPPSLPFVTAEAVGPP